MRPAKWFVACGWPGLCLTAVADEGDAKDVEAVEAKQAQPLPERRVLLRTAHAQPTTARQLAAAGPEHARGLSGQS